MLTASGRIGAHDARLATDLNGAGVDGLRGCREPTPGELTDRHGAQTVGDHNGNDPERRADDAGELRREGERRLLGSAWVDSGDDGGGHRSPVT